MGQKVYSESRAEARPFEGSAAKVYFLCIVTKYYFGQIGWKRACVICTRMKFDIYSYKFFCSYSFIFTSATASFTGALKVSFPRTSCNKLDFRVQLSSTKTCFAHQVSQRCTKVSIMGTSRDSRRVCPTTAYCSGCTSRLTCR